MKTGSLYYFEVGFDSSGTPKSDRFGSRSMGPSTGRDLTLGLDPHFGPQLLRKPRSLPRTLKFLKHFGPHFWTPLLDQFWEVLDPFLITFGPLFGSLFNRTEFWSLLETFWRRLDHFSSGWPNLRSSWIHFWSLLDHFSTTFWGLDLAFTVNRGQKQGPKVTKSDQIWPNEVPKYPNEGQKWSS